jgi:hypothetical protein
VVAVIVVWVLVAALTTSFMARRGHAWFQWAVVGAAMGPLSWPLAAYTLRTDGRAVTPLPVEADVLVAVPPWVTSVDPILESIRVLEPLARTATLVSVLETEAETTVAGRGTAEELDGLLARCGDALVAAGLVDPPVERRILYGRPADELARFAAAGGFRAIVLGPSARRPFTWVRGRTRARLERLTDIPVVSSRTGVAA